MGEYRNIGLETEVDLASPHRLVQMLLEGALDKIAVSKGCVQRGEIDKQNTHITWAVSIINGLRMSLDKTQGGEIAQNLDDLYDYMSRRLMEVSRDNDLAKLDEVTSLILEVKSAWDAIPGTVKGDANTPSEAGPTSGGIAESA
ncbi:MAG TPA: flagellar export chaperone FliS [Chromatiaceae bacterium]|nr:flagellar export chaperone FliS [Chromatiaceae bacterium]